MMVTSLPLQDNNTKGEALYFPEQIASRWKTQGVFDSIFRIVPA